MKLEINGQSAILPDHCATVGDLLNQPEWKGRMLIVEHNGKVLFHENVAFTLLSEGDRIELIHVVGGG
ncbi:MAG: hypothetical protein K0R57_1817 [Paenibacillaceae bacterium]|jgi:sulfur carrier protein|nr:hypothetical protein [Paenibacillaceae bacterium]